MSLFRFLGPRPLQEITEETTLSAMKNLTDRLSGVGFREFTAPLQRQSGAGVRLGRKGKGTIATIGIIPSPGVKVP